MRNGVTYADVRVEEARERHISTKNGKPANVATYDSMGVGIRVIAGAVGDLRLPTRFTEGPGTCRQSCHRNCPLGRTGKERGCRTCTGRSAPKCLGVVLPDRSLSGTRRGKPPASDCDRPGAAEHTRNYPRRIIVCLYPQTAVFCVFHRQPHRPDANVTGAGFTALSFKDDEIQKRSYPNSFGGQYQLKGYELVRRIGSSAARAANRRRGCRSPLRRRLPGRSIQSDRRRQSTRLQIHESIGHPIELDRVLGSEANYAGMSFLTLDKLNTLRYGSDIVNVVCDARPEHGPGLGTFAFDDEGVPAQCAPTSSATAVRRLYDTLAKPPRTIGQPRSSGTMRADGWARLPLIRMTNVSLLPGDKLSRKSSTRRRHLHGDE